MNSIESGNRIPNADSLPAGWQETRQDGDDGGQPLSNTSPGESEPNAAAGLLEWSVHPSARHPVRTALTVMAIAMIAGALFQATGAVLYSLIAVIVLLISLAPYFLKTEYRLDASGITMTRLGRIRRLQWNQIRTISARNTSIYVSAHPPKSLRERHGLLLLCPDNRDSVADFIQQNTPGTADPVTPDS